jgi:hypothetical protein
MKKVFSTDCFQTRDEIQEFMETRFIDLLKSRMDVSGVIEDRTPTTKGCVLKLSFELKNVPIILQLTTLSKMFLTQRNEMRPVYMDGEPDAGRDWVTFMDFRDPQKFGGQYKSPFYMKSISVTHPPRYENGGSVSCFLPTRWMKTSETRFEFEVFPLEEWKYGGGFQLDGLEIREEEVA